MPAYASIELAEAEVAVSDERAHAQFVGQNHGLPVGGFSLFGIRRVAMRSDVAESPESPRWCAGRFWSRARSRA
jgi:hypothetical protein